MENLPLTIPALKAEEIRRWGVRVQRIHRTGPEQPPLCADAQQTAQSWLFSWEGLNMASTSGGLHYLNHNDG